LIGAYINVKYLWEELWRCCGKRIIKIMIIIFIVLFAKSFYVPNSLNLDNAGDLLHLQRVEKLEFIRIDLMKPKGVYCIWYGKDGYTNTAIDTHKSDLTSSERNKWSNKKIYAVYGDDGRIKFKLWLP
jgi:hypothetical protein